MDSNAPVKPAPKKTAAAVQRRGERAQPLRVSIADHLLAVGGPKIVIK